MNTRFTDLPEYLHADKSRGIAIVTHTNPDGDALGSSLGLFHVLIQAGFANVQVITPNDSPGFLQWLPGHEGMINAKRHFHRAKEAIETASLIFCLDFNGFSRADLLQEVLIASKGYKMLIDHHPQPEPVFDGMYSDITASSTAELVYRFVINSGWDSHLNKQAAECLYAGIITDTGSLSYSCNNPETYRIVARLMEKGIDGEHIHRLIYNTFTEQRLRLLGYCLLEKLVVMPLHKTAYIGLTRAEMDRFHYQIGDTEGIVNYALSIQGVEFAALFTENKDHIKASFRSAGTMNVNQFAREHFDGGGHQFASGGKSYESMQLTLERFENLVKQTIKSQ